MGPYCKFCDNRCFSYIPMETPEHILQAFKEKAPGVTILANCPKGQDHDKSVIGYNMNDIRQAIKEDGK